MVGTPALDSISVAQNTTNGTRDVELDYDAGQERNVKEIRIDNNKTQVMVFLCQLFTIIRLAGWSEIIKEWNGCGNGMSIAFYDHVGFGRIVRFFI